MRKYFLFWILLTVLFIHSCTYQEKNNKQMKNPLLAEIYDTPDGVPPFDKIKDEDFLPAFKQAIKMHEHEIQEIVQNSQEPNFENTIKALDMSGIVLSNVWNIFSNLNEANTNENLQKIALEVSPLLSEHFDKIYMDAKLFDRVKKVYDNREILNLNSTDSMLLEKIYLKFVMNGALLSDGDKQKLQNINKELSVLTLKFGQNVLAEVNRYKLVVEDEKDLEGLPENLIQQAAETAINTGDSGKWVFTINRSVITPFLTYSKNRDLRKQIFTAYISKGNHDDSLDNKEIINDIVNLRLQKARILGYETWGALRTKNRMAKTPQDVYNLLNRIWEKALPAARAEADELQKMIYKEGQSFELQPWDWWYYAEKLRKEKYDLDENQLRPYFALDNVLEKGVFYTLNNLYGMSFKKADDLPVYHNDVRAYRVFINEDSLIGVLYLDFFPRESKRGGAWSTEFRPEYFKDGKRVPPVVSIVCNFTKPTAEQPSLLSLDEVRTLFHEFGHATHTLLSVVPNRTLSGTSVALDFVELPSQIMEEWAVTPQVLRHYAIHYKTGEVIPDELIKKIENSQYFNQGFATVEYMAAAYLDMDWHTVNEEKDYDVNSFEDASMTRINMLPQIIVRYRSTYFNHAFSGGYSAGYYVYIWADVLVQDAFEYFREQGIFDKDVASKFKHLLEMGGSEDPMQLYIQFRGRKPSVEPLLKSRGFIK